jgi:uncharacterized CHY-type Zn-finger protein
MNEVLGLYLGKFVQVYLDDIIIYYPCIESHYQHVKEVLMTLRNNKLVAKKRKCSLFYQSLQFQVFDEMNKAATNPRKPFNHEVLRYYTYA